jgi:mono/diheme cytochrome c family protein
MGLVIASSPGVCAEQEPSLAPQEKAGSLAVPKAVQSVFASHCLDCHGAETAEGDVRLDNLATLKLDERLELLNKSQEEVFFQRMPPADAQQLKAGDRTRLANWVSQELKRHGASKLEDKLRKPGYGNYVDHDKLFSGEYKNLRPFTYDRRWLISEFIFDARFNQILNHKPFKTIDGKRHFVIGDNNRRVNLTNPFLLPTNTGVRYYANTTLNGGHLLTMITNAKEASTYMVYLTTRDKRYVPAIAAVMSQEWEHEKILASRESFLNNFIARILQDLYKDKHNDLLPRFVRVEVKPTATGVKTKKAPYHAANPGTQEVILIFRSMRKQEKEGDTDAQIIEKCEQEWFNLGHNERKIQARITFLNGYMTEFRGVTKSQRFDQKHKPFVYRPPQAGEMKVITKTILKHRQQGDRFNTIISKCISQWEAEFKQARIDAGPPGAEFVAALVDQLFVKILERSPTADELDQYVSLTRSYVANMGNQRAIEKLIQTLMLRSDFVYRYEFGQGEVDEHGRRMLSPRDASYALAYALTDSSPDQPLIEAANNGRLNTKDDYRREVLRLLKNRDQFYVIDEAVQRLQLTASITNTPIRKLRFFREFFGYPKMLPIFKDNKRFGGNYDSAKGRLVGEADRLVDHFLQKDQEVIKELLTTEDFYVYHSGDNEAMAAASQRIRRIYEYFKDKDWQNYTVEDLAKHKDFLEVVKMRGINIKDLVPKGRRNPIREFKKAMTSFTLRFDKGQTAAAPFVSFPAHGPYNASTRTGLQLRSPQVANFFNIQLDNWNYPGVQPAKVAHRKGMLTHPAWLIAHAQNTETDPVKRGRWIREKLLADTVPDVPITVDAVIPEDPHKTLRQRVDIKTGAESCWKCHKKMNPLGLAFEMYDDFGRYRTEESLEYPENLIKKGPVKAAVHVDLRDVYKTLPVNAKGSLDGTGDKSLDGDVNDAIDLIDRLARSKRVRQSIIRYAFRYFMGRNEILSDSTTLIDADRAYLESGGSFDAVIMSLLTSDSFIYRKAIEN